MTYSQKLERFLSKTGLEFPDMELLRLAFTHRSFFFENPKLAKQSNEELEFLGDAVLGLIVANHLYSCAKELSLKVGDIAKSKSWLVSEVVLADAARTLDITPCILLGYGAQLNGEYQRDRVLADTLEAIIGAYYLASSLEKVSQFVLGFLEPYIKIALSQKHGFDYKSLLQNHLQKNNEALPCYKISEVNGAEHEQIFTVEVTYGRQQAKACGRTKKSAEQMAAKIACKKLSLFSDNEHFPALQQPPLGSRKV